MKYIKTIKLKATKGTRTIAQASDIFTGYIDPNFKNWGLDVKEKPTKPSTIDIFEMDKDATFKELFLEPEKQVMTQDQVIEFCINHKDELNQNGYANFFLIKRDNNFFVASVSVSDGRPGGCVDEFSDRFIWRAYSRHRVFSPQLDTKTLSSKKTLESLDTLSLDSAIKICKENGLVIYKPL